jgi:hypothetical protein
LATLSKDDSGGRHHHKEEKENDPREAQKNGRTISPSAFQSGKKEI